jgi:hypothetical protein
VTAFSYTIFKHRPHISRAGGVLRLFQKFRQYLTKYPVLLIAEPFSYCIVVFVKSVYKQSNTISLSVRKPDKRNRSGLL